MSPKSPVFGWVDWSSWLFGVGIDVPGRELGLHFGPFHLSVLWMPR